ncbi:MAG: AAA family ATPase [Flavobacteriales bacterium]
MASKVEQVSQLQDKYQALKTEISKLVVGQEEAVDQLLLSIFCNSHCLLVGVPGLAKTLMVNVLSKALGLSFNRIQFTPDLMPSDIIGSEVLNKNREFEFVKGPLFSNVILADEINRTPPKTQSALLEAMQEKTVSSNGQHFSLGDLFFVLATQNPIEQEGTYSLPEAQLDRFMFQVELDYPSLEQEIDIVKRTTANHKVDIKQVISAEEILGFQKLIRAIPVPDAVLNYTVKLVQSTRTGKHAQNEFAKQYIAWGAGPRASQNLILAAKAQAALSGKYSPDIEDVMKVAKPILQHRVLLNYKAKAKGIDFDDLLKALA